MNWKNRFTNYNFWISIVSAVLLILQAFEFQFDIMYINEIATAVLGLLVVIGIINDPTKTSVKTDTTVGKKEKAKDTAENVKVDDVEVEIENVKNEDVNSEEKIQNSILNKEDNILEEQQNEEAFPIDQEVKVDDICKYIYTC